MDDPQLSEIESSPSPLCRGSRAAFRPPLLTPRGRERLTVAVTAYALVGLFGIAYGVIALVWPGLPTATTTIIAALIAAPAALGLIWPQLTAFKAFGVEVSLEHASERAIEPGLVDSLEAAFMAPVTVSLESLTKPDFSAPPFQEQGVPQSLLCLS